MGLLLATQSSWAGMQSLREMLWRRTGSVSDGGHLAAGDVCASSFHLSSWDSFSVPVRQLGLSSMHAGCFPVERTKGNRGPPRKTTDCLPLQLILVLHHVMITPVSVLDNQQASSNSATSSLLCVVEVCFQRSVLSCPQVLFIHNPPPPLRRLLSSTRCVHSFDLLPFISR